MNSPLTVSFRCARKIVEYAQQWNPLIQSSPDAPEGEVLFIDQAEIYGQGLTIADAVICRNNAPLVSMFFELLRRGIPAHIEGRDFADQLLKFINKWRTADSIPSLVTKMTNYKEKAIAKAQAKGKDTKAAEIADMVDSVLAIIDALPDTAVLVDLKSKITLMFHDEKTGEKVPTLTLSTSHKAKGREWNRVFWLGKNRYNPSPFAHQPWQMEQEDNLCYVTATRAKHTLVIVRVPIPPRKRTNV